jgi:hypothetical protein
MAKQLSVGEIVIDKLQCEGALGSFSLITHLEELNIYEDIFSNTLRAHITLQESYNLPQYIPFMGEETIDCSIRLAGVTGADEGTIIQPPKFHVHDLSDRFFKTPKSQRYSIDLVSEQYMSNLHSKVSKSYADSTITSIVRDIWNKYLDDDKDLFTESTERNEHIIIPNWHPHDAFNWLATRAVSSADNAAHNFLYYETMSGSHFMSLNSLIDVEPSLTFALEPRKDDSTKIEALSGGYVKVDKIIFDNQFHKIKNIKRGQYSSKLITHDIVKKKIAQHDFNGFNEWFAYNHLGAYPPLSNSDTEIQTGNTFRTSLAPPLNPDMAITEGRQISDYTDSRVDFYPKHDKLYAKDSAHEYDNYVEDWFQRRNQQMQLFDGVTMHVECGGLSFIRVGLTVTLQVPSPETTSHGKREVAFDTFLSGKYMVTAIKHVFTQQADSNFGYKMLVELTKDGLSNVVPFREPRKQGASK